MEDYQLDKLLRRPTVEDIVLGPRGIAFFESGHWQGPYASVDCTTESLQRIARHVAEQAGITLGLTQPSVDSFFILGGLEKVPINFRAHVVISPLVQKGPEITLRRLPQPGNLDLENFSEDANVLATLRKAVKDGKSILIAGSTGSGKTSLLTSLLNTLDDHVRVLVLEDSPELALPTPLSTKLLARNNKFGFREGATWDLSHLVYESLRMRPDRIIVGECRGPEAAAIATALETGHTGLMTTLHAGSAGQALERFQNLVLAAPERAKKNFTAQWDLVLHLELNHESNKRNINDFIERKN